MNVKGFNSNGENSQLTSINANETHVEVSRRFQKALLSSPSEDTEIELVKIIEEIYPKKDDDYEKMLIFQCRREIAKSMIKRGNFEEAIPHLVECLKVDSCRANLWADLAKCASETQRVALYRAAISKLNQTRPQFEAEIERPQLPIFTSDHHEPEYISFFLPQQCYKCFFKALMIANQDYPSAIPAFIFQDESLMMQGERKFGVPEHMKTINITADNGKPITKIGQCDLLTLFSKLDVEQLTTTTWLFSQSIHYVTANALNQIADLKYKDHISADIAKDIIQIAQDYVFNELTPTTRLFIAELAYFHVLSEKQDLVKRFLKGIMKPYLHMPNALLRINVAILELAIRENRDPEELNRLYNACKNQLKSPIVLSHIGRTINEAFLSEKKDQIDILKTIDDPNAVRTTELATRYFGQGSLKFLSLRNAVNLFRQFSDDMVEGVLFNFLHMLPPLIRSNSKEVEVLKPLLARFTYPMSDECVKELGKIFNTLSDVNADKTLKFSCALAQAYAAKNYKDRCKLLVSLHSRLGEASTKACHLQGGKFLEILLDALLDNPDAHESDITKAFNCYFSNVALTSTNHDSHLQLRCGPYIQKFYEHAKNLEDKNGIQTSSLFTPYLEIWMHYTSELSKPPSQQCLHDVDGWRIYNIVKRKESMIPKAASLPKNITSSMVLEDMLRHDPQNRPESRIALAKVIARQFLAERTQEAAQKIFNTDDQNKDDRKNEKLSEVLNVLEEGGMKNPTQILFHSIILSFMDDSNKLASLQSIAKLEPFTEKPKTEARRLYWIMRLFNEIKEEDSRFITPELKNIAETAAIKASKPEKLLPSGTSAEYFVLLLSAAGDTLQKEQLFREAINKHCKSRVVLPHPFISLAKIKINEPNEAFKVIIKLARTKSMNINNFFHFDFKVPFLMAAPDDLEKYRKELLSLYIDTCAKSGNYLSLFTLINPNGKTDRKLSRVFKDNRFIYQIDRISIFIRYVREFTKDYETTKKKDFDERAIDAIYKGIAILEMRKPGGESAVTEELSSQLTNELNKLKDKAWKKILHADPPTNSTCRDFLEEFNGNEYEEEEEEEDGDFKASDMEEEEEEGNESRQRNGNNEEEEEQDDQEEESGAEESETEDQSEEEE